MLELIGVGISDRLVGRLDRLSFEVREGEVLGLVGGSGAGKTAALAVAAGQVTPQRGRVTLEGRDVSRRPGRLRAIAGLAPEALPGPHDLSAADWLAFWAALDGVPGREVAKRRAGVLELFGLAAPDDLVAGLSRGARRRLGLARLWLRLPRLLLLDAPGDGLDGDGLRRLTHAIRQATSEGRTIVLTDASPHLPCAVCDRVVCLAGGAATGEARKGATDFQDRIAAAQGWSS